MKVKTPDGLVGVGFSIFYGGGGGFFGWFSIFSSKNLYVWSSRLFTCTAVLCVYFVLEFFLMTVFFGVMCYYHMYHHLNAFKTSPLK